MGLDKWLVKVSWLGKLTLVFWWVELDLFSLECNEVSSSEFCGVSGFGVTFGSRILMLRAMSLYCWRTSMVCLALELVGSVGRAWFQCRYGGFWMSSY